MYLPMALGYIVIAERYIIDTLAYIGYWGSPNILQSFLAKVFLGFIPRDSVLFYLDAKMDTLLGRIENDTVTRDFIVFQKKTYDALAKMLGANVIDTSKRDVQETFEDILGILDN